MKSVIAALLLVGLGLTVAPAQQTDGFLCTPYRNGNPAGATIYCAYLDNASLEWVIWGSVYCPQGQSRTFYDGTNNIVQPDLHIPYGKWYKFCAWNGAYRSEWTDPVYYTLSVYYPYELNMTIYCPMEPDPNEEE